LASAWRITSVQVALSSVLAALAIAIPFAFRGTPLQIYIPAIQYSGTAASHVPSMIAILIGPSAAAIVGLASTIGFLATLGPVIAARAFIHVLWGIAAALYFAKGGSYTKALFLIALPIHVLGEGLVVYSLGPIFGVVKVAAEVAALWVSIGTLIHHVVDSIIALAVYRVAKPILLPVIARPGSKKAL
jgi:niacin transporter